MFAKLAGAAVVALVFSSPLSAATQEPVIEYGQASELQGVTKVFVDTGPDLQQRNLIAREIRKRLPAVEVVSQPEETDIHLRFYLEETQPGKTDWVGPVVKVVGSNRVRVLLSYKDETPPIFTTDTFVSSAMELAKPHMFVMQFREAVQESECPEQGISDTSCYSCNSWIVFGQHSTIHEKHELHELTRNM